MVGWAAVKNDLVGFGDYRFYIYVREPKIKEAQLAEKAFIHHFLAELKRELLMTDDKINSMEAILRETLRILKNGLPLSLDYINTSWIQTVDSLVNENKILLEEDSKQQTNIASLSENAIFTYKPNSKMLLRQQTFVLF